jgi:endo-1,4-beta-mannosidase
MSGEFLVGVNYWPRAAALSLWERFDAGVVRDDFAHIAALRLHAVRCFLTWETFQPEPQRCATSALRDFERLLEIAADNGLRVMPTLFCGHMSGINLIPRWALDRSQPAGRFRTFAGGNERPFGIGDFYADPDLLRAQVFFARSVASAVRSHPALFAWDLGNEFSNLRTPRTPHDAALWSRVLSETLEEISETPVTGGLHGEDLSQDRQIRISSIAAPWRFCTMHGYPVYSSFARSRRDPEVVPFLCALTAAFGGKPVLFTEFGNPACPPGTVSPSDRIALPGETAARTGDVPPNAAPYACLDEEEMAIYARAVLDRLQRRGALGAFWWCFTDYDEALRDQPPFDRAPHELRFGMVRADGSEKPVAHVLAAFACEKRTVAPPPPPFASEEEHYAALPEGMARSYRRYVEERGEP